LADLFGKVINKKQPNKNLLGQAGVCDFVIYDQRRTCRTLMASLGIREEIAEQYLNHNASNIVRIYNRDEYKQERKEAHKK
jgi:tagatose-1,6-bisphosphate aldolase